MYVHVFRVLPYLQGCRGDRDNNYIVPPASNGKSHHILLTCIHTYTQNPVFQMLFQFSIANKKYFLEGNSFHKRLNSIIYSIYSVLKKSLHEVPLLSFVPLVTNAIEHLPAVLSILVIHLLTFYIYSSSLINAHCINSTLVLMKRSG